MDIFKEFLVFSLCCLIFQGSHGRKLLMSPYYGSINSLDESKSVEENVFNSYPESRINGDLETADSYKIDSKLLKGFQQKLPVSENEDYSALKADSTNYKTLEMQVGEHLVKVKSKKEYENLNFTQKGGEYNTSINPKYSHIIEIIHRRDDLEKQDKPAEIKDSTTEKLPNELPKYSLCGKFEFEDCGNTKENIDLDTEKFGETDEGDPEEFGEADEGDPEEFGEADEGDPEEFGEADEGDPEEFGEADEGDPEEFGEADEGDPEEFGEADGGDPEEFGEADEGDPDEFDKADEGDPDEFDKADERDPDEFDKADEHDPDEFGETDEGDPQEFTEMDEGDPQEFGEADEGYLQKFDETDEKDVEEIGEADERNPEGFGEADEKDSEGFGEADEKDSEEFNEADEQDSEEYGETDKGDLEESEEYSEEFFPNGTEDKIFVEETNTKQNGTHNKQNTSNKEESAFSEDIEGSGEEFAVVNDQNVSKTGRIILGMFSRQNETSPTCTTPKGEAGHCRRLGECLLSEALNNFNGFLQQLCLIRGVLVGICCPDNPVIETVNPDENATSELKLEEIKQPPEGCGLNTKTRIVGGSISVPHEWTWMVALMRRNRFYCGGVIINNWYILTAAHCVMGMNVKDLTVRLGEYDFNEESKHTEDLSVSEIKRHAQFVTLTFQHDIALLKLKQSIKYSKFVGSICLPEEKARDYSDVKGTVVGWGTVSFGGAASPILRQVTIPVWKNKDCDRTYLLERIGDSFLCAGSPEKGEDACQGDSGGPLMTVSENGRWEVIGLVSWGRRCGDPTYPGVYTRVTTYLDWIKQNAV